MVLFPVDLSKISDVVKNDDVTKAVYDKLVEKVNNINTSGLVLINMTQINQNSKILDRLILVGLLRKRTTIPKLLKLEIKHHVLVV